MSSEDKQKETKKTYAQPKLTKFGSVKEFTRTFSMGSKTDGGAFPASKKMCITSAPEIEEHRVLLGDRLCQESFLTQMQRAIKPGDVVLDLGSGSGLHAMYAVRLGASKVYAIEAKPIIELAKKVAIDNGMSEKIEFIYGDSLEVELPEKVDVIVTNIGFLGTIESLPDAAMRFLKPGGSVIPDQLQLNFTPVDVKTFYEDTVNFWSSSKFGFDFSALREMAANHPLYSVFTGKESMAEGHTCEPICLTDKVSDHLEWQMNFTINRSSVMTGFMGWYSFLHDKENFLSTKPPLELDHDLWQEIFLPFDKTLSLKQGDQIQVKIGMYQNLTFDSPLWRWSVVKDGELLVDQCSFDSIPLSKELLKKLSH